MATATKTEVTGRWQVAPQAATRRAGLVVRVSTDRQAANDEGSLKTQLQRLRKHIDYRREACAEAWVEVGVYELRAVSGKDSIRSPEFQRLFADIRSGRINTVLCTALDRISRSVKDFLHFFEVLNEYGVEFVCLKQNYDTTTSQGKLFITIMMALAEFEREQTSERTREATAARAERGLWNGGRLLGYDPDPNNRSSLVPHPEEAVVVNTAFDLYLRTGSLKETAEALNRRGHRMKSYTSRRGKQHLGTEFRLQNLQGLLKNRAYIGQKVVNKKKGGAQVVPAVWPPIVDQDKFEAAQRLMGTNGNTRHNAARPARHVHVLSGGLLQCGRCGSPMEGRSGTGRLGKVYFYYVCKGKDCGLRVIAGEIEDAVIEHIGQLANEGELLGKVVGETNRRLQRQLPGLAKQQRALQRQLDEVKRSASGLLDGWQSLEASQGREFVTDRLGELAQRRQDLERGLRQVEEHQAVSRQQAVSIEQVRSALASIHDVYGALQPYERRELVQLVVHRVELGDRQMVLEINGGICRRVAEAPVADVLGAMVRETQEWLPGLVPQSVLQDVFEINLPSLASRFRREVASRVSKGQAAVAMEWQRLLDEGVIQNRAELARRLGMSRAGVTQALARDA